MTTEVSASQTLTTKAALWEMAPRHLQVFLGALLHPQTPSGC